jgi:flap endonuclease-1
MAMYQFLVAVRSSGPGGNGQAAQLVNEAGEVTSHIQGMFNRTIKMMTSGVKPVYIFDGKPPQMKGGELAKRLAKRAKAETDLAAAKLAEDVDEINKYSSRLVKVNKQHNEDCKELLRLMGVPVINAPCEAEAQCAELARKGKVYATATEDMDALTFRTPKLVRKMTFSQMKGKDKQPILEVDFAVMLAGLELTYEQFVDLCILCGCDYCGSIKGIGPKTALKLVRQHKNLETIVAQLVKDKYDVPDDWFPHRMTTRVVEDIATDAADASEVKADPAAAEEGDVPDTDSMDDEYAAGCAGGGGAAAEEDDEEDLVAVKADPAVAKVDTSAPAAPAVDTTSGDAPASVPAPTAVDTDAAAALEAPKSRVEIVVERVSPEEAAAFAAAQGGANDDGSSSNSISSSSSSEIIPPMYVQARSLFVNCEVHNADEIELKWEAPDEAGLTAFLVERMGFNAERVVGGIKRLKEAQMQKSQKRMDRYTSLLFICESMLELYPPLLFGTFCFFGWLE